MPHATALPGRPAPDAGDWLTPGRFAVLLACFIVASFPTVLAGSQTFVFRDYGMFSYPVAFFHRESVWHGELPLWNPYNNCGLPFLAQWNTMALYPLSLIYLLLPLPWSLSFFCLVHLFIGGMGMYFLAWQWTHHRAAASLAGVIFAFNGLSLNFLMWPSHIATFAWLPWVLLLARNGWLRGGRALAWAALAGAMEMLAGGPETIAATWLVIFTLACGDYMSAKTDRRRIVARFTLLSGLVAAICAAQLLPFLELLSRSQRDPTYLSSTHDWSLPFWGWANFLVPLFRSSPTRHGVFMQNGQYWTSSYYAGVLTVLLIAVGIRHARSWPVRLLAGWLVLGMVLALGDGSLLYRALHAAVPALGLARYPVKFLIITLALAPLLAAVGFASLEQARRSPGRFEIGAGITLLALIAGIVAVDWHSPLPADVWNATWKNACARALFFVAGFGLLSLSLRGAGARRALFATGLIAVTWLDLMTHVPNQNPTAPPAIYTPDWVAAHPPSRPLPAPGVSRAMVDPKSLEILKFNALPSPEQTYLRNRAALRVDCNLLDHAPQIDGFFSLTPRESMKLTSLPYTRPNDDHAALLDFMGVTQTTGLDTWSARTSALPLITMGQSPAFTADPATFTAIAQSNLDFRETVLLPESARPHISARREASARVVSSHFANQRIRVTCSADAPAVLVLSQTAYPAWKAYIDNQPATLWRANYAFQALQVPAGSHEVVFAYDDGKLKLGALLSALGLAACGFIWWRSPRRVAGPPGSGRQTAAASG
jgi:hypothetical protein